MRAQSVSSDRFRERFNTSEFSALASLMKYWQECESLEQR